MKKLFLSLTSLVMVFAVASCDIIDKDQTLLPAPTNVTPDNPDDNPSEIDITQTHTEKYVLAEEFTGQKCLNCPKGHRKLAALKEQYGKRLTVVGIHAGPGSLVPPLFRTEAGDAYYSKFANNTPLPALMVSRKKFGSSYVYDKSYKTWDVPIAEQMEQKAKINIFAVAEYTDTQKIKVTVKGKVLEGNTLPKSMVQVYLLEDKLIAPQVDGNTTVENYEHNHVLRGAVNGIWGEEFVDLKDYLYTYAVEPLSGISFVAENYSIVAFVYDVQTFEVYDVVHVKINPQSDGK